MALTNIAWLDLCTDTYSDGFALFVTSRRLIKHVDVSLCVCLFAFVLRIQFWLVSQLPFG